jgi:uncharacterized protein (DUF934 family)
MVEVQITLRDDAPVSSPAVPLADFAGASNAAAVRIEPGEDARALLGHLDQLALVEVNFPGFGDGRGYSAARILREAGFTGELRAVGDVLVDQIAAMRRCGFDSFAPVVKLDEADVAAAFDRWPDVYQATTDGRVPIWNLRHG